MVPDALQDGSGAVDVTFYVPLAQWPSDAGVLHVRVTGEPSTRLAELRRVVAAVNPSAPVIRAPRFAIKSSGTLPTNGWR